MTVRRIDALEVRIAAIKSISGLVPSGQRTLLLGPALDDPEQSVRFAAANALLGLSPDTLGLYFGPLQQVLDEFVKYLKAQPETAEGWIQLAQLYIHSALLTDDLPIDAYLDRGFGAWLDSQGKS